MDPLCNCSHIQTHKQREMIFHLMFRFSSAPSTEDPINLPAIKFVNW